MTRHTVIIGGGSMGSSTAYFLSTLAGPDETITVVERDTSYRIASSSLSASSIRQQFSTALSVQLSQFSFEFMRACTDDGVPGSSIGLIESGYLCLASAQQAATQRGITKLAVSLGARIHEFAPGELARRYPWMYCDDIAYACIALQGEGCFDGHQLQQVYRSRARANGVNYVHANATGLRVSGSRITAVELADGSTLPADRVVNASGAWAAAVANMAGVDVPIHARKGSIVVASCPKRPADLPIMADTSGTFLRPEQQHVLFVISPKHESSPDNAPLDPNLDAFETRVWPALAHRIPAFESLRVEHAWAGYYEYNTADHNGLVGQIGPDNFYLAAGFSGHGLMHSPGIGRGVAELLTHGAYQTLDLSSLAPQRLQTGKLIVETAVY